jgi:hypothetical protein
MLRRLLRVIGGVAVAPVRVDDGHQRPDQMAERLGPHETAVRYQLCHLRLIGWPSL